MHGEIQGLAKTSRTEEALSGVRMLAMMNSVPRQAWSQGKVAVEASVVSCF